jgi:hypothetical protein
MRGVGGSNLLRFLCEPRVVASHLGADKREALFIYLQAPEAGQPAALFVDLAARARTAARAFGWPRAEQAALRSLAGRFETHPNEGLFELMAYLCGERGRRVVIALDEFDRAMLGLPGETLRALRGVRDEHKTAVSYLLGVRREPAALAAGRAGGVAEAAKFAELFQHHTFPVKPYSRQDAQDLMRRKSAASLEALSADEEVALFRLTGGHAKLLVAALVALESRRHLPWPEIERGLRADPFLVEVCAEIWAGLDPAEQAALRLLAAERGPEIPPEDLARVKLKGLAAGSPAVLFSEVFEAFVHRQAEPTEAVFGRRAWLSHLRDPSDRAAW